MTNTVAAKLAYAKTVIGMEVELAGYLDAMPPGVEAETPLTMTARDLAEYSVGLRIRVLEDLITAGVA